VRAWHVTYSFWPVCFCSRASSVLQSIVCPPLVLDDHNGRNTFRWHQYEIKLTLHRCCCSGMWRRVDWKVHINGFGGTYILYALKMEKVWVYETLVSAYQSTRRHSPEEHRHSHRCESLKSHVSLHCSVPAASTHKQPVLLTDIFRFHIQFYMILFVNVPNIATRRVRYRTCKEHLRSNCTIGKEIPVLEQNLITPQIALLLIFLCYSWQ
jgi:hypothetical protein